jgi:hypothetical protein
MDPSIAAALAQLNKTLAQIGQQGLDDNLAKAWLQSNSPTTGLTAYDLEAPAKTFTPIITPLRNMLPRVGNGTGTQANWRAVTKLNTAGMAMGVAEGQRGGVLDTQVTEYLAAYRSLGVEDFVTFEADLAAAGFDDVKARAVQGTLKSLMLYEEQTIVAGNGGGVALGTTPTPTVATATTGGSIANTTTVSVICVALTMEGYLFTSMNSNVPGLITRTNADGTTVQYGGGSAQQSAAGTVATGGAGNAHLVTATVAPVKGALAYAWYAGTAGAERFHSVTLINSVVITALPTAPAALVPAGAGADRSVNATVFDGFISLAAKTGSGAYWQALPTGTAGVGTPLTSDGAGGIVEIDAMLKSFWDNLRLSPTEIHVSAQEMANLRKKVLSGASNAVQRFTFQTVQGNIVASGMVRGYLNPFGIGQAQEVPIKLHPTLPPGTIMALAHELPYQLSGVQNVNQIKTRRDYYQLEWPLRTRRYEYGVYTDQVLQCYFPPSIGVITNIANG